LRLLSEKYFHMTLFNVVFAAVVFGVVFGSAVYALLLRFDVLSDLAPQTQTIRHQ